MITRNASLVPPPSIRTRSKGRFENRANATFGPRGCHENGFKIVASSNRLVGLFGDLLQGFDQQQLRIMHLRTFRTASGHTLQNLGNDFGISRERVRQIESDCIKIIKLRLKTVRFRPLVDASARIAETIGLAAPISVAEAAGLRGISSGSMELENRAVFMRGFLLWLCGPYEVKDDWVIKRRPANQWIRKTRRVINSLLRGGPASSEELVEKVCAMGFRKDVTRQWVSAFGQVRFLGSKAIRWEGSLADKATAILEFQREPMSKERISELLGSDHSIETLKNYLSTDQRFKRFGINLFGLTKWGGKEYRTIADTIEDVIHTNGGEAPVSHIIKQVSARANTSESSIRASLHKPRFQVVERSFRVRQPGNEAPKARP
jgi:hypothetical protein